MLLLIDNYDSFTYNLAHYFRELGANVVVKHNDKISLDACIALKPSHLVISPGPCTPNESGISMPLIKALYQHIPILGVCLGHQAIAQAFGSRIHHAQQVMHGKLSTIEHNQCALFNNIPRHYAVTRYHSLVVDEATLPSDFEVSARVQQANQTSEIMAIRHKQLPIHGVQFHPEAILTEHGHTLLSNFLAMEPSRC